MARLPRLYAIIDAETCARRGVSVVAFARGLREGGVRLLQYRDKQGSPQAVLRAAAAITDVFAGTGAMLVMNDRADLAVLAGWRGVHVGHLDMPVAAVRRVLGQTASPPGWEPRASTRVYGTHSTTLGAGAQALAFPMCFLGVSTHNDEQVRAAETSRTPGSESPDPGHPVSWGASQEPGADYVAMGPVFATASKADTEPVVGLEGVRRARALTRKPLVAIGGITRANARAVIEAGADSVAVIGGLFAEGESVMEVARDFLRILG